MNIRLGTLASFGALLLTSCGGSEPSGPEDPVVTSVVVSPASTHLTEGGETSRLTATVQTDQGSAAAPAVSWSSSDPSVASVASSGTSATITPGASGIATVSATSGGVTGTATVVVEPGARDLVVTLVGQGTLTSDPVGLTCTSTRCEGAFPHGTVVELLAAPADGHRIDTWGADCSGTAPTCALTMDRDRTASVAFEPKVEENGLSRDINDIVPDTLLAIMRQMGMPVYTGATPPRIEGSYLMHPSVLLATNVPGDPASATFVDFYLQFTDQDDERLTVTTRTAEIWGQGAAVGVGLSTFIVGEDDTFSVFAEIVSTVQSDTVTTLEVYSGRLVQGGVEGLSRALFMLDGRGNPAYIPDGTGRVIVDQDGWSPTAAFPEPGPSRASAVGGEDVEGVGIGAWIQRESAAPPGGG